MIRIVFLTLILLSSFKGMSQFAVDALATGDLIFIGTQRSDWSHAINDVTQTSQNTNYHHVGLVIDAAGALELMHASSEQGVEKVSIEKYLQSLDSTTIVDVYRIQKIDTMDMQVIDSIGTSMIGAPYNFSYILNDSSHYCSEFVYHCFEPYGVFELSPMTFKVDGATLPFWSEYFQNLGLSIPEGQPGCNPNGMAANKNLQFIGRLDIE